MKSKRLAIVIVAMSLSVGCDQASKKLATAALKDERPRIYLNDLFRLQYSENHGAFLGLGGGLSPELRFWMLTVSLGILLTGVFVFVLLNQKLSPLDVGGLSLVLGGGWSNWIDRTLNDGAVIDFMNMGIGGLRTGIFNFADLIIELGVILLFISIFKKDKENPPAESDQAQAPT